MSLGMQDLVLPVLAAGAVAAVIRTRRGRAAKTPRGRLRDLAWCSALLLISVCMMLTSYQILVRNDMQEWLLLFPLAAAIIVIVRPRLAARIVPMALIFYGLAGFVVARDYAHWGGVSTYGLTMVANPYFEADLVLPQAYALVLGGGWLTWRSADPLLARSRLLLRRVAALEPRRQLQSLLLLPVVAITAGLIEPNLWLGSGPGIIWTVVITSGAVAVLRRWPELAGRLAALGVVCLGLASLSLAATWAGGSGGFPVTVYGDVMDGAALVGTQHTAEAAAGQGLALLVFGAWLVPQAFPELRRLLGGSAEVELTRRVELLTESRAVAVDTASADLRRLERDLHDGAQARLVALGMNLRAAERLILTSPDAAIALVAEARETSARALTELRELVRGVLPPVLADRGLSDAVRALALDCPLTVTTEIDLPAASAG